MKRFSLLGTCLIISIFFILSTNVAHAHYDPAFETGSNARTVNADWMKNIPDTIRASDLSIPGTHDTMAHKGSLDVSTRTQSMNLDNQLKSGIRYLDIRNSVNKNGTFQMHHGFVNLGSTLDDVLNTINSFFNSHPTETIYMRFSQENTKRSGKDFADLFRKNYYDNPKYQHLFYKGDNRNPDLATTRKKIVLILNFGTEGNNFSGIDYYSIDNQDKYSVKTNWDVMNTKWPMIKEQFHNSNRNASNGKIYMNHLSASQGSFPYFVAGGRASYGENQIRLSTGLIATGNKDKYVELPRSGGSILFAGTNVLSNAFIQKNNINHTGIVAMDFPGQSLISNIISLNRSFTKDGSNWPDSGLYFDLNGSGIEFSKKNIPHSKWNDQLTSVILLPNEGIYLYEHSNYSGKTIYLENRNSFPKLYDLFAYNFDDKTSSYRFSTPSNDSVGLYEHPNGNGINFYSNHTPHKQWNDKISSVLVPPFTVLTLYDNSNFSGYQVSFTNSSSVPVLYGNLEEYRMDDRASAFSFN